MTVSRWRKEGFVPQYRERGREGKELKHELERVCNDEDDFEQKEYEIFSKYVYTDTPGLMEEIIKL